MLRRGECGIGYRNPMKSHLLRAGLVGLMALAMTSAVRADFYNISELDAVPQVDMFPAPVYPWEMKQGGTLGMAILGGVVDEKGKLVRVEVVAQSDPAFGQAALEAARKWRFATADRGTREWVLRFEFGREGTTVKAVGPRS